MLELREFKCHFLLRNCSQASHLNRSGQGFIVAMFTAVKTVENLDPN